MTTKISCQIETSDTKLTFKDYIKLLYLVLSRKKNQRIFCKRKYFHFTLNKLKTIRTDLRSSTMSQEKAI